jgi:hypothetical protein
MHVHSLSQRTGYPGPIYSWLFIILSRWIPGKYIEICYNSLFLPHPLNVSYISILPSHSELLYISKQCYGVMISISGMFPAQLFASILYALRIFIVQSCQHGASKLHIFHIFSIILVTPRIISILFPL